jgi:hypothetical protein
VFKIVNFNRSLARKVYVENLNEIPVESADDSADESGPVKSTPLKSADERDPVKSASVKSDAAKSDATKSEPVKSAPVKSAPVNNDTVKSDPIKSDAVKSEPVKSDAVKSEPVKSDPVKRSNQRPHVETTTTRIGSKTITTVVSNGEIIERYTVEFGVKKYDEKLLMKKFQNIPQTSVFAASSEKTPIESPPVENPTVESPTVESPTIDNRTINNTTSDDSEVMSSEEILRQHLSCDADDRNDEGNFIEVFIKRFFKGVFSLLKLQYYFLRRKQKLLFFESSSMRKFALFSILLSSYWILYFVFRFSALLRGDRKDESYFFLFVFDLLSLIIHGEY